jgi:hypothetical protein
MSALEGIFSRADAIDRAIGRTYAWNVPLDLRKLLLLAKDALGEAKAPHALMGAFGMSVHGYQRATNDLDFLVHGDFRNPVENAFKKRGFEIFHSSDELIQLAGKGPVDIIFANRELSRKMLERKALPEILGVPCLLVEDIIGLKIQALINNKRRRFRDLADIQALAEKNRSLDWTRVKMYADLFGIWNEIASIKKALEDE